MMKKNIVALAVLISGVTLAQNVGINTTAPAAAVDVVNPNSGNAPKHFRLVNSSNQEFLTVTDSGVGINRNGISVPISLDILTPASPSVGMTFRVVNGTSYFGHSFNTQTDATFDQASVNTLNRDQGFYFSVDNDPKGGFFIGPRSDKSNGIFIGENGLNAVYGMAASPVLPRATLDVQGSIAIGNTSTCENGTLSYNGNLQGCINGSWVNLNN